MADIARLGYQIETSDVATASRQLDEFARENVNAAKAARSVGPAAKTSGAAIAQASRNARGFGRQMGASAGQTANLTAQLNDIGVMLAAGQNPLQLALQQGTQVNQVFAQMGGGANALRGIGAAFVSMVNPVSLATLGIIAGGAALIQWATNAGEANTEADLFIDRLESIADRAKASKESLRADLRLVSEDELFLIDALAVKEAALAAQRAQALSAREGAQRSLVEASIRETEIARDKLAEELAGIREVEEARARSLENARKVGEAERLVGEQLQAAMRNRAAATAQAQQTLVELRRQAAIQRAITNYGAESAEVAALRTSAEREANAQLVRGLNISEDLKQELLNAWEAARGVAGTNVSAGIEPAVLSAEQLANKLGIALGLAQQIAALGGSGGASGPDAATQQVRGQFGGADNAPGRSAGGIYGIVSQVNRRSRGGAGGGSGGGGGGGGSDPYASDLEALVQSLQTERETVERWYAEGEVLLNDRRAREVLGAQEHQAQMLRLEEEYHRRIAEINDAAGNSRLQQTATVFGALADVARAGGGKLAKAAATLGGIEATINAYRAASQALADPSIPFAGKFAAYAAVLATGLKSVQAIKSAGGGGGGGAGGGISAAPTTQQQQEPQRVILQGLDPNALFTGEMIKNIFDGIFDENNRRGGVIVVNT